MKKATSIIFLILILVLTVSCKREDLNINQILAQPYVHQNGDMGLSLYLRTSVSEMEKSSMVVKDPSQSLSWTVDLTKVQYQCATYYGTSNIAMPNGSLLPTGDWKLELLYKDGRTVSDTFTVSYQDKDDALSRTANSNIPLFDATSNLTILP